MLLGLVSEGAEGLPQGGEPLAVVHQVREVHRQLALHVGGILVDGNHLQALVGLVEDGAAGGLVHAPVLHAHQPVLHDVQQADAVLAAQLVQLADHVAGLHLLPVHRHGHALFKVDGHVGGLVGGSDGADAHLQEAGLLILGLVGRVLQIQALVAQVP